MPAGHGRKKTETRSDCISLCDQRQSTIGLVSVCLVGVIKVEGKHVLCSRLIADDRKNGAFFKERLKG